MEEEHINAGWLIAPVGEQGNIFPPCLLAVFRPAAAPTPTHTHPHTHTPKSELVSQRPNEQLLDRAAVYVDADKGLCDYGGFLFLQARSLQRW